MVITTVEQLMEMETMFVTMERNPAQGQVVI